ncbi:helix-turn-helix transcriptional regulator [Enterococcus sp. LJL98]
MNKVLGYRKMIGFSQLEMAKRLGISESQYRAKEKGRFEFTETEIEKFTSIVKKFNSEVTVLDIFFNHNRRKPTY